MMQSAQERLISGIRELCSNGNIEDIHNKHTTEIHVVEGDPLLNQWKDPFFFTAAFPTLFPRGLCKHKIDRRDWASLGFSDWTRLMVLNSSRYYSHLFLNVDFCAISNCRDRIQISECLQRCILYRRQKEIARETFVSQIRFRICQHYEIQISQPKISQWKLT